MLGPHRSRLLLALSSTLLFACGSTVSTAHPMPPAGVVVASPMLYRLPVLGTWEVQRTHVGNTRDQAYAFDMFMPAPDGKPYKNSGKANTDWPAYGQPVVADGPGVIAIAVDGIPDNTPGAVNAYDQHGNYVVIDHQNGEFSLVAHLIPGSLRVRVGQAVTAGTELGRCGNSGQTTNPHVHWQVMDSAMASSARPVLQRYLSYDRNGQPYSGMPDRGDHITFR